MNRIERRILARFASRWLRILLLLAFLPLVMDVPKQLGIGDRGLELGRALVALARYLNTFEVAVIVSAGLGMVMVVLELKQGGILTVLFGAGMSVRRVRSVILTAALLAAVASAAIFEAAVRARSAADAVRFAGLGRLWKAESTYIWSPRPDPAREVMRDVILFREDSLDVSRAPQAWWSPADQAFRLSSPAALMGSAISLDRFAADTLIATPQFPPPPSAWLAPSTTLAGILAGISRIGAGGILLAISAYLALLLPRSGDWSVYLAFALLSPAIALGTLWSTRLLWSGGAAGYVFAVIWLFLLTGLVVGLDRAFCKRGLRLS